MIATAKLAKRGLRVARTRVGKGLFATKTISDYTCIGEIEGKEILDLEYTSRYAFDLENGNLLEPAAPFRFVNHSCEPNCAFEVMLISSPTRGNATVPPQRQLLLFAICDIYAGEELTIDYGWPAHYAIPCCCRAPSCRGWIVDATQVEALRELQRKTSTAS